MVSTIISVASAPRLNKTNICESCAALVTSIIESMCNMTWASMEHCVTGYSWYCDPLYTAAATVALMNSLHILHIYVIPTNTFMNQSKCLTLNCSTHVYFISTNALMNQSKEVVKFQSIEEKKKNYNEVYIESAWQG